MTLKQKITKGLIGLGLVGTMAGLGGMFHYIPDKIEKPAVVREYTDLTSKVSREFIRPEVVGSLCEGYDSLMSNPDSARSLQGYISALDDFHKQDKKTIPYFILALGFAGMLGAGLSRYQSERQERKEKK